MGRFQSEVGLVAGWLRVLAGKIACLRWPISFFQPLKTTQNLDFCHP